MSNNQIPGVPEGWELVHAYRQAAKGEWYIDNDGTPYLNPLSESVYPHPIIRKIEKPATYRQFANAEEFKPHRDRWLTRKDKRDPTHVDGACRVVAYDDQGSWFTTGDYHTWEAAFDSGRCFDDDGTPFGVKIDE
jgi:hypothetical protein